MTTFEDAFSKLWQKLASWFEHFVLIMPNFVVAVVVLVIFWFAASVARRLSDSVFRRVFRSKDVAWLVSMVVRIAVVTAGLVIALGVLGLDKTVTSLLAGAGIVGLAVALAFQDLGQNVLAGIYISLRHTINRGDLIESNGHFGIIHDINLRSLHMHTAEGQLVVIPNREIFQNTLTKFSTGFRRIDLAVGISYGDNLDKVEEVTRKAVAGIKELLAERGIELFFTEFGDSSINFVVRFWIKFERQAQFMHARSEAVRRIKKAYDENGITIPFPIRTLDFGIKGGEKLSQQIRTLERLPEASPDPSEESA